MKLRAGSACWLLRHELRLYVYNLGSARRSEPPEKARANPAIHSPFFDKPVPNQPVPNQPVQNQPVQNQPVPDHPVAGKPLARIQAARRGPSRKSIAFIVLVTLAMHAFAFAMLRSLSGEPGSPAPALLAGITAAFALAFSMMLSQGLKSSVEVLFERGDLDLLLSSPLSSRSIFSVRLAAIVIGTAGLYLFLLAPFANVGLLLGQWRWLGLYPTVLGSAALAVSLSMLLTLALVRVIGVRRTRVLAQVLSAIVGAIFFLATQVFANIDDGAQHGLGAWLARHAGADAVPDPRSLLWLPARAVLGEPLALLVVGAAGLAAFWATVHFTHRFFVHGLEQAVSTVRAAAPSRAPRYRFGRSLFTTVLAKEWRLIARDPQLISQVLLQLLYMLPLCFMLVFKSSNAVPGLGASLTFLCASLTTSLAWIVIAAEDAPDLLRAAPAAPATVARAKLVAAAVPALALMAVPLLWLALQAPLAALLLAIFAGSATVGAALVVRWCAQPAPREQFRRRAKGNFISNFLELGTAAAWAGLSWTALSLAAPAPSGAWAAVAAGVLLALLMVLMAAAWWRRTPPP